MRRVGKSVRRSSKSEGERCPPFRMRLPMDGGHGARAPFAHPTQPISNSIICRRSFAISPHVLREFDPDRSALGNQRAQGMPGARCARSRACSVESTRVSHHGHTGKRPAFPARWFTAYIVLSPGTGLFCPRHLRGNCIPRKLSASVGAPGPHDFAVRVGLARQARHQRPPHPRSTSVTIAKRPSGGAGRCEHYD
jgi:hypothetical protein